MDDSSRGGSYENNPIDDKGAIDSFKNRRWIELIGCF